MKILFLSLLILSVLTSFSLARECDSKDMIGTWKRLSSNLIESTYWTFTFDRAEQSYQPDTREYGTISCTGDCNRAAGLPISYEWTQSKLTINFEKYSLDNKCTRDGNLLILRDSDGEGELRFRKY